MTNINSNPRDARLTSQLNAAHGTLLVVHKALLDHERERYEKARGPVRTPGEVLQLVIGDPWFAWLRTLSGLLVQIDEYTSSKETPVPGEGEALLAKARALLVPDENGGDFQRQYQRALQESPAVAHAHGLWKLTLLQFDRH